MVRRSASADDLARGLADFGEADGAAAPVSCHARRGGRRGLRGRRLVAGSPDLLDLADFFTLPLGSCPDRKPAAADDVGDAMVTQVGVGRARAVSPKADWRASL